VKERRLNEIKGVILIALGLIILASLVSFTPYDVKFYTSHPNIPPKNFIGTFGAFLAYIILFLLGWPSFFIPFFVLWWGVRLFRQDPLYLNWVRALEIVGLLLSASSLIGMLPFGNETMGFNRTGFFGFIISRKTSSYIGPLGGYILFITLFLAFFALVAEVLISTFISNIIEKIKFILGPLSKLKLKKQEKAPAVKPVLNAKNGLKDISLKPKITVSDSSLKEGPLKSILSLKSKIKVKTEPETLAEPKAKAPVLKMGDYRLPTLDLLDSPPPPEARQIKEDLTNNAHILEDTLGDFGISVDRKSVV
jgi:S-DNA-T family DNA segregation ATPase FtsK/SpoIIIE